MIDVQVAFALVFAAKVLLLSSVCFKVRQRRTLGIQKVYIVLDCLTGIPIEKLEKFVIPIPRSTRIAVV